jgi:hypothetical protein
VAPSAHTDPTPPSPEGVSARARPEAAVKALTPCERVEQHNLALLREATARVAGAIAAMGDKRLTARIDAAEKALNADGANLSRSGARLDSLDEETLSMLAQVDYEVRGYLRAREQVTTLKAVELALRTQQPIPLSNMGSFEVELCKPDAHGAWAFWTVEASYQPRDETWGEWDVSRQVALARISASGALTLARRFPSFLHGSSSDTRFPGVQGDNCCAESYGVGEPQLLFLNDQNGDSIPEIGLRAEYAVEGSHDLTNVLYRFDNGTITEEEWPVDSMTDVDGDGRLDIIARDEVSAADQCGSGFPSHSVSPPYLGHALPDGTYAFADPTARAYLLKQCPSRPKSFGDAQAIWCAKAWGVSEVSLSVGALRLCEKDPCQSQSNRPACETLESAIHGLKPPLRLDSPRVSP